MTWFAVPDDLVGGWSVADRQVPTAELDTRPRPVIGRERGQVTFMQAPPDMVICWGCKSQEDARRIAAALNFIEHSAHHPFPVEMWSAPWPEAKEEA